ncbi:hypothetical protein KCG44_05185 [Pacificimonas sp. WHA3]|uniref:Uncharacterized protein n=1 Tax=Pacificimonas pallii TaxID=2827236 RepID=A0ABS6SCN5_9SPHN|nr:hypothetical protein [Pacificimonas pallii]MBV7256175.1 hypothetical protein [Pacificimonas pallii]
MKLFIGSLAVLLSTGAVAETITNADVVQLVDLKIGDAAIVAKIEASEPDFALSTDDMIALKNANVSGEVIAAMLRADTEARQRPVELSESSADPLVPHRQGVYLLADWEAEPRMMRIDPITSNQTKTGGLFGYALTAGIASLSVKAVIPGENSQHIARQAQPKFYFYFDQAVPNGTSPSLWTSAFGGSIISPNEFSLVRLKEKKKRREARVGSVNIAGAKSGVMDKDQIAFSTEELSAGIFMVTPSIPLEPGEYGFVLSSSAGGGSALTGQGAQTSRVFDFSISEGSYDPQ